MKHHMEKTMEYEMEAGVIYTIIGTNISHIANGHGFLPKRLP